MCNIELKLEITEIQINKRLYNPPYFWTDIQFVSPSSHATVASFQHDGSYIDICTNVQLHFLASLVARWGFLKLESRILCTEGILLTCHSPGAGEPQPPSAREPLSLLLRVGSKKIPCTRTK